ncbi:uncharacterized protein BP5553_10629 [Venustampulla echinocandica]|uniref:Transcription factor domain-containing protein n=1 Tax=Venustampulla echinocandica TaxID=2656787 RepID=A0A370T933_9HELO|nr:uncharacterized protein BP5553_10629 [Venustampulla echinocandica]RDL30002.1 hypothetical protein BP5553_10629 [Venustampulla echinocandica]
MDDPPLRSLPRSKNSQADFPGAVQGPRDEVEWDKDTTAEVPFLIEDQNLSYLFNDYDDIITSTSNMDVGPLSTSSHYTYPSASSQGHFPFSSASSAMYLPTHSYESPTRSLQGAPAIEFSQNRPDKAKVINKWSLDDPLDNTSELLRALKQMPEKENSKEEGFGLPWCLSTGQGPSHRYVGSSFWALSNTRVPDCDRLLEAQQARLYSKEFGDGSRAGFVKLLQSLPSKKLCDVLLRSFLLGVRPLLPLVHGPTLQAEYDTFWVRYNNDELRNQARNDLTDGSFLCLLWSVLYCGAVAASPSLLAEASIHVHHSSALLLHLRTKLEECLTLCKYAKLPTLNGLIASILARECDPEVDEILTAPAFVTQVMQAAMTLGLHSEEVIIMAYGEVEGEIARRVWYHIIYLEVLATLTSGSSLSHSSSEESYTTKIPQEFHDISIGLGRAILDTSNQYAQSSSAMLLAIGRFEMTRVMRKIVEQCYNHRIPAKEDLRNLIAELELFQRKIDVLIGRLQVRGTPEHGHISTQLLTADPLIHKWLYQDNPHEETVFNAYARIGLYMTKHHVLIFFNRQFLSGPDDHQTSTIWNHEMSLCCQFLRSYLNLARLPAFSPYQWLFPGKLQPLQQCMLVLTYLKEHPQNSDIQLLQHLISEVFDIFRAKDETDSNKDPLLYRSILTYEESWQMLHEMRGEIGSGAPSSLHQPQSTGAT